MNSIRLLYISPRDVRKNRSDAVHIMLSCQAFANIGVDVVLLTPKVNREEYKKSYNEIFSLYGIEVQNFKINELKTNLIERDNYTSSVVAVSLQKLKGHLLFLLYNLNSFSKNDIIYSKCYISTIPYIFLKKIGFINSEIVFETVTPKNTYLHRYIYRNVDKIISPLSFVTKDILKFAGVNRDKIFEPRLMTQSKAILDIKESKIEIRKSLNFKKDKIYVLYAGKTGDKVKEVEYFIECAKIEPDLIFIIVGANKEAQKKYNQIIQKESISNLIVYPFQPLTDYYKFVLAADVLVGYYPATYHNKFHLSPGKSGIYLASNNPCVFSDLPSLRSVFPEDTVFYAKPDDPNELARIIRSVISNPEKSKKIVNNAYKFAIDNTYDKFAHSVLGFLGFD